MCEGCASFGCQGHVFQAGGGLETVKVAELENERLVKARELATICGKPPRLCSHALSLFQNNNDAAFNWLMDHGTAYVPGLSIGEPPAGSYTGFAFGADGSLRDMFFIKINWSPSGGKYVCVTCLGKRFGSRVCQRVIVRGTSCSVRVLCRVFRQV